MRICENITRFKSNPNLKQVYVLISAYSDNGFIVSVHFEIKEFYNDSAALYLTVALTKINSEVMGKPDMEKTTVPTSLLSEYIISLLQIFKNVNVQDKRFLKYVPDEFLYNSQIEAKRKALKNQSEEYDQ